MKRPTTVQESLAQWLEVAPDALALRIVRLKAPELELTVSELLLRGAAAADWYAANGVGEGDIVPVMRGFGPALLEDFIGLVLRGAVPCVMAPPNPKMSEEVFTRKLLGMLGTKELGALAVDESLLPFLAEHVTPRHPTLRPLARPEGGEADPARWLARRVDPDAPAFLQHSSGTSGVPKAVEISHRRLLAHAERYGEAIRVSGQDRIVSWLPLYHDMGMVACLWGGLLWRISGCHMGNFEWLLDPAMLLREASSFGATLCWLPNFAFSLMARAVRPDSLGDVRLDSVRWISCSEPVLPSSLDAFAAAFTTRGVRPESLAGCYAMAENVFAVSQTPLGAPPRVLSVDRDALAQGRVVVANVPPARRLASSGRVVGGTEVAILTGEAQAPSRADGAVGEIVLRGECALERYHGNPDATAKALRGGWYHTGDLGFLWEDEVFVVGRSKDMVIVAGRNVDPTEIEQAAMEAPGVLAGRVCCLGLDDDQLGTQELHVVVETREPRDAHAGVQRAVKERVRVATDFAVRQVWCVEPGWLVKSSSGKIARPETLRKLQLLIAER